MAPPENNVGVRRNDVIFYDVIRNSDRQMNYVFQQAATTFECGSILIYTIFTQIFGFALNYFYWLESFLLARSI